MHYDTTKAKNTEKFFILNADDFGLSSAHNRAVLEGCKAGIITSASLCVNGEAFNEAVKIAHECPSLGLAVHLNIMEGKSLTGCSFLTDDNGVFNKGYGYLLCRQFDKKLLSQIETEFRAQIEKALQYLKISHLDSHVHTHGIPSIFKIVCKLAKEYDIPYIRTQFEIPYFVPGVRLKSVNLIKILLLNFFTLQNRLTLKKFNLKTNDGIIGVGYTGMMSVDTLKYGLSTIKVFGNTKKETITEALFHPCKYLNDNVNNSHSKEFQIVQNQTIRADIEKLGFSFANYSFFKH